MLAVLTTWRAATEPAALLDLASDGLSLLLGGFICAQLLKGVAVKLKRSLQWIIAVGLAAFAADLILVMQFDLERPRLLLWPVQAIYLTTATMALFQRALRQSPRHSDVPVEAVLLAAVIAQATMDGRLMRFGIVFLSLSIIAVIATALLARGAGRYRKSGASDRQLEYSYRALRDTAVTLRMYCSTDLSLDDLAAASGVPRRLASQALTGPGKTSFADMIATLRAEEAARLLAAPKNATVAVEPIGMEAGFRSRSAFYATFKRIYGVTPVQYRDTFSK